MPPGVCGAERLDIKLRVAKAYWPSAAGTGGVLLCPEPGWVPSLGLTSGELGVCSSWDTEGRRQGEKKACLFLR